MNFKNLIEQITVEFITHWNNHDLDKMATYLSNDITVSSPNIQKLFPEEKESKLSKKENVMRYWRKLNDEHFFTMKLMVLNKSEKIIDCQIAVGDTTTRLHANFIMDEYGKFVDMDIEYI